MSCFRGGNTTSLSTSSILSGAIKTNGCREVVCISLPVPNHHRPHHLLKNLDRPWTRTGWFEERSCHIIFERLGIRLELGERQGVGDNGGQLDQILLIVGRPDSRFTPFRTGRPGFGCIRGRLVCRKTNLVAIGLLTRLSKAESKEVCGWRTGHNPPALHTQRV